MAESLPRPYLGMLRVAEAHFPPTQKCLQWNGSPTSFSLSRNAHSGGGPLTRPYPGMLTVAYFLLSTQKCSQWHERPASLSLSRNAYSGGGPLPPVFPLLLPFCIILCSFTLAIDHIRWNDCLSHCLVAVKKHTGWLTNLALSRYSFTRLRSERNVTSMLSLRAWLTLSLPKSIMGTCSLVLTLDFVDDML